MPRFARVVIPECPHHVTQRGNNRQDVFFAEEDYRVYLSYLAEQAERYGLRIDGYCLMTNHIHLIATPSKEESLAKAVGRTHFLYTQYVNRMHGRSGHLWQNRFFSCPLDEEHFYQAMAYVERNPVKARMHRKAWLYPWSSAAVHCGMVELAADGDGGDATQKRERRKAGADGQERGGRRVRRKAGTDGQERGGRRERRKAGTGTPPEAGGQSPFSSPLSPEWTICAEEWKRKLMEADEQRDERIRVWTQTGRPLGRDRFVSKLESALGRRLRPLAVGRPRKAKGGK